MKNIITLFLTLLLNIQLFAQIKQNETDSTISYYGQFIDADTVLTNFDYHVKISLSETLKTENVKKSVTISKDITLDSLKLMLEKALKTINIETEIRLIEVIDYKEIHKNGGSVILLEGTFEFYVSNEFDIHKIYNYLADNFSTYIFKGFIAVPYIDDSTMNKITENLKVTAERKILVIAKNFSNQNTENKVIIQSNLNYQPNFTIERIPRNEYGQNNRIYINNESPKIKTYWNYMFTVKTK